MGHDHIVIKGARQHNLHIGEVRIPKKQLVVFTGVSGSGKSSLAFDTLYAEGQRRYVESLSSYARQFLGQMEKPSYDHIQGLSPTIAIEQKAASGNPRSTVGTITEIHDYLRVLYARLGVQYCPECGTPVQPLSVDEMVTRLTAHRGPTELLAPLVAQRKGRFSELFARLAERGYGRVRVDGQVTRLDSAPRLDPRKKHTLELVVDRLDPSQAPRARLFDSVETALREGKGTLVMQPAAGPPLRLSQTRACPVDGRGLPELTPQAFSFNGPLGMCEACNGLGRLEEMDADLVIPDPKRTIRDGAIEPLASVMERGSGVTYAIFAALQRELGLDLDVPWRALPKRQRHLVLYGAGDTLLQVRWKSSHGRPASWAMRYEGLLRTLMRRYRETKSEDMRQYYQRYLSEQECPACRGTRLRAESRAVRVGGLGLADVSALSVDQAHAHFEQLVFSGSDRAVAAELLKEITARLEFLRSVGLGYLSLDRAGPSLAGGEAQRIRLASQLGSELSGVIYVLDEPSIGLHPSDNRRLIETLRRLRDADNTVIVVEHDAETIESADHVIDFGPGAGRAGGHIVFAGTPAELERADTLTGRYLSGRARIEVPAERRAGRGALVVRGAREHNLKGEDVAFPLGTLTAVTGVSGAGKSSLVAGVLYPALARRLHGAKVQIGRHAGIEGLDLVDKVIRIDQSPIGRTPRSNPATYTKCFDLIRDLFAEVPEARALGFKPGRFSFNVAGGRCEACSGDGVRRVEMHFLPDVYVPCDVCHGKRYNEATLQVRYRDQSIADVLDTSVAEALGLFGVHRKLHQILQTLSDVGLDYVHLGQPAPTLSGGEAQRVKLSRELARTDTGRTLYVLDEPTTGLHFDDIKKLLGVLGRLVESGNTVIIIEHNLDVIKCADHVIDLGPGGGAAGGRVVATGTPERIAQHPTSLTGAFLRRLLGDRRSASGVAPKPRNAAVRRLSTAALGAAMLAPMADHWWGHFELGLGQAGRWRVGPLILTVAHLRNEWRVSRGSSDDPRDRTREVELGLDPADPGPGELVTRYTATDGMDAIQLTPVLPDRSVVTRPEQSVIVPARGSGSLFVGSPLFLRLEEAGGALLEELPAFRPKLTWWGPNTRDGTTCYASRTAGRLRLEEVVNHPHRVVTEVSIINRAATPLQVERLNLPVRRLAVYADQRGELWTESVVLELQEGEELAELHLGARPPEAAGVTECVAPPRDASGNLLFRAFGSLFQ